MGVCCEGRLARNVNKASGTQGEQVGSVLESSGKFWGCEELPQGN